MSKQTAYVPACKVQRTTSLADRVPRPLQLLVEVHKTFHGEVVVDGMGGVFGACAPSVV